MLFQGDGVEADESYALRFLTSAAEKVRAADYGWIDEQTQLTQLR